MKLDDWHMLFVSICLVLVLIAFTPIAASFIPNREEPFCSLAVLGEQDMVENYYPGDDPWIDVGEEVHWNIHLYSHMVEPKYVALRIKFLNFSVSAPNSTFCIPSVAPVVLEVRRVMMHNQTWVFPFTWSIQNVDRVGDVREIRSLSVNSNSIDTHLVSPSDENFRVVFELWVYDEGLNNFQFGWGHGESQCIWNLMWFNVKISQ